MADERKYEESSIEVIESCSREETAGASTVNLEQNINVVNIDMGKHSLWEKIDFVALQEWISNHMVHIIIGGIFVLYSVVLIVMGTLLVREKKDSEIVIDDNTIKTEQEIEVADRNADINTDSADVANITAEPVEAEEIQLEDEIVEQEDPIIPEESISEEAPITDVALYDLSLVGASFSEKKLKATNSVGEELEDVFILSGGVWGETVAFYLDGKYDSFYANICCMEEGSSFDVNIYLDDGPCVQTVHIQQIMARTPIDIDVSGATFIRFECTGSFYNHGAILSDGIIHVADDVEVEN